MTHSPPLPSFAARTQQGEARGRDLGYPTVNLRLEDVPPEFEEGIYACRAEVDGRLYDGAMHYGPRPAFKAGLSCEIYFLDVVLPSLPHSVRVTPVQWLREVRDFATKEALTAQIADDVTRTREALRES